MKLCPKCKHILKTIDSRYKNDYTRRRKECTFCKHRITTIEIETRGNMSRTRICSFTQLYKLEMDIKKYIKTRFEYFKL